jgi:serine/threonine protein kinase
MSDRVHNVTEQNVLRAGSGACCMGDFGLAQCDALQASGTSDAAVVKEAEVLSRFVGDLLWAAPEAFQAQMSGDAARKRVACNEKTDVFSLGLILWRLTTGRVVDARGRTGESFVAELPEQTPPAMRALLERMLSGDPAARPVAAEVVAALGDMVPAVWGDAAVGGLLRLLLAMEDALHPLLAQMEAYREPHALQFDVQVHKRAAHALLPPLLPLTAPRRIHGTRSGGPWRRRLMPRALRRTRRCSRRS